MSFVLPSLITGEKYNAIKYLSQALTKLYLTRINLTRINRPLWRNSGYSEKSNSYVLLRT